MSLFGTVSRPATGVCVLKFHQQSVVHAQAQLRLSPNSGFTFCICGFSLTYMHEKPGRRTAS